MKLQRIIFFIFLVHILTGCAVGINTTIAKKYPPLDSLQEVKIFDVGELAPANAEEIGKVEIFDNMTMHCDSAIVYSAAKTEARKAGGNILKVTEHLYPNLMSSCHRIKANILKSEVVYDSTSVKPSGKNITQKPIVKHDSRFALNAGWGWQTSKIPDNAAQFEKDYLNELKSGSQFGLEYNYFVNQSTGIGLLVNLFHSSHSVYASAQLANGTIVNGTLSDNIDILYIAPNITWRILSPTKKNAFLLGVSIGYMNYNNQASFNETMTLNGGTLGFSYDLSYDYGISKSTALGIGFSWKIGTLSSVDVTQNGVKKTVDFEKDQRLGLGHLDLSIGLRF